MNAVKFKETLDKNREAEVAEFLKKYKEKWNETIEETINKILIKHAGDSKTTEPFKIRYLNCEILQEEGDWEPIDEIPHTQFLVNHPNYRVADSTYYYDINVEAYAVKRKWFGSKIMNRQVCARRKYKQTKETSYSNLNSLQKIYFNKILTDKGFFVGTDTFDSILYVYWNKDQYDSAMK